MKLKIPHECLVLVCDGRKALFLRNQGDDVYPNLRVQRVFQAPENPKTSEIGSDKPGRAFMLRQRSAVEQFNWHDAAELAFADEVAKTVNAAYLNATLEAVVVAAPPRTLAELRERFSDGVKKVILAEINKDLTKHPVYEIEQHLTAA
ncbi:host attachment protein [Microvirga flavescens]|uniref:host attachment protein n=1 Tax=Microvirga flavescens TaxID=2249811 RepID=UPI000DD9AE56|nr:host attachment family protein [Microvirga flavescens]